MTILKKQENGIKTGLRLPPSMYAEIKSSADYNGLSLNAEIILRLKTRPVLEELHRHHATMELMQRQILELLRST